MIHLPRFSSFTRLAIDQLQLSEREDPTFGYQYEMLPISFCYFSKALKVTCEEKDGFQV